MVHVRKIDIILIIAGVICFILYLLWDAGSFCPQIKNPYSVSHESGHFTGYEWAREKELTPADTCGGNSQSFIDGCKEYERQVKRYYICRERIAE